MKRRTLLKSLLVAPCGGLITQLAFAESVKKTLDGWRVGMSVAGYDPQTVELIEPLRKAGFDTIQLSLPVRKEMSDTDKEKWLREFKAACDQHKLVIEYIHVPFSGTADVSHQKDDIRKKMIQDTVQLMDWNTFIQASVFVIHPSSEPIADQHRSARLDRCVESLTLLNAEAKRRKIRLAVENLPRTCLGNTSQEMNEIVRRSGDDLQICFDTNHSLKEKPEEFLAGFKGKVAAIHVSDYDFVDERHWIPYEGRNNWKAIVQALLNCGYSGSFMFESIRLNTGKRASWEEAMARWQKIKESM